MKTAVTVIYDDSSPNQIQIGVPEDHVGNAWDDLGVLLEGVGLLANACFKQGITEHNGQPLPDYLKSYIDNVFKDYNETYSVSSNAN